MRIVPPSGPIPAKILIVGEAPGADEEVLGQPFVGTSGQELNRMLQEAGISRSEVFVTNVCRVRPPNNDISAFIAKAKKDITRGHVPLRDKWVLPVIKEGYELLLKEINIVKPSVIIALGNTPLWALTGHWGITKWRGSTLQTTSSDFTIVPTYHPAAVLRQWDWRAIAVQDLRRAARIRDHGQPIRPKWRFIIRPTYDQVVSTLNDLQIRATAQPGFRLSFDLETRNGHIACAGISWTYLEGISIPFMCTERAKGYWSEAEECDIIDRIRRLLTHSNVQIVGQNIIYDAQYTWRHWHFVPNIFQDTMISGHCIFSDMPKNLAFLASMNCKYYVYWKDEGKNWREGMKEDELWFYNCEDCTYTDEVGQVQLATIKKMGLEEVHATQQALLWPVLRAMQLGVKIDLSKRAELTREVQEQITIREQFLEAVLGHKLNPRSPKQMMSLFYDDLKQPIQFKRGKKGEPSRPSLDDEALQHLAKREPLLRPLISAISDIRTLGIFLSGFLEKELDEDNRMRCSYNIGGSESGKSAPKTYRLSSSENAFNSGTNLQTIPSEKSKSLGKAAARGSIAMLGDPYQFPNIRSMFVPDLGKTFFDGDLDRADLQVFVWEIDDKEFKELLKMGVDIHLYNAYTLANKSIPPVDELIATHPKYYDHRQPMKFEREFAKVFCHATDYYGMPRTVAAAIGKTVHEVDRARKIYLGAHQKIEPYWETVKLQVKKHGFVENRFGYRWYIFDRLDSILPEAIAWIPQSTVSVTINKIWLNIHHNLPAVEVLLQVHDSLCGQLPTIRKQELLPQIMEQSKIVIPYADPLIIPFHLKTSEVSWGDCE